MNNKSWLAVVAMLLCSLSSPSNAAAPAPPLTEDQSTFVERTRLLERDPFATEAREIRQWLLTWVTKAPEVTVNVCDVLGPIPKEKVPYGSELLLQSMFGNAAFQLEHPEHKSDAQSTQLAGIESLLKAYAGILAAHPEAKIPYFDDLRKKQLAGKLEKSMVPLIVKKCAKT